MCYLRLLLPVQALPRGRTDRDVGAMPELHVQQPDAHVLPQRLSVHQAGRKELHRREEEGRLLSHHQVPARSVKAGVGCVICAVLRVRGVGVVCCVCCVVVGLCVCSCACVRVLVRGCVMLQW